jgi:hypothetical protein
VIFSSFAVFRPGIAADWDSGRPELFCDEILADVGDSYALIAARSGRTPMMLMTRVRL